MDYTFDASQKRLGRFASEIAIILQGKNHATYNPKDEGIDNVIVKNCAKLVVSGRKYNQKKYYHHTGPLGHLKEEKFADVFTKKPEWVLRHAVERMLPKNRLRARRMKRLIFE